MNETPKQDEFELLLRAVLYANGALYASDSDSLRIHRKLVEAEDKAVQDLRAFVVKLIAHYSAVES